MRKNPYKGYELFEEITKNIQEPEGIEYTLSNRYGEGKNFIKNYEFDILTRISYGGCEGVYTDVYISGRYDEESSAPDMIIGTIKTLNTDDDSVRKMYTYASEIFLKANDFVRKNIDDFTWLGFDMKIRPEDKFSYELPNEEHVVKRLIELIKKGEDISELTIMDNGCKKYISPKTYIKMAKKEIEEE